MLCAIALRRSSAAPLPMRLCAKLSLRSVSKLHRNWAHPPGHICSRTRWAHPGHICAGTRWAHPYATPAPATSAPGLGSFPAHICAGTHERVIGSSSSTSMCLSCRCVRTSEPATGLHSPGAGVGQRVPARSSTRRRRGEHAESTRRRRLLEERTERGPRKHAHGVLREYPVSTP